MIYQLDGSLPMLKPNLKMKMPRWKTISTIKSRTSLGTKVYGLYFYVKTKNKIAVFSLAGRGVGAIFAGPV
jgi:hypothetical protein